MTTTPKTSDNFIQRQLDVYVRELETSFTADAIAFNGPIVGGVDEIIRDIVEVKRATSAQPKRLAFVITTYGGYIEIVEHIVDTVRHHYDEVDFIIPSHAYSAGTLLAMSGDSIHMDYYSRLGPIDPQVESARGRSISAIGYLRQYERLLARARNSKKGLSPAEVALLVSGFDQGELYNYEQARELSVARLKEWLAKYKFKNWTVTRTKGDQVTDKMRVKRAEEIARELNKTEKWHAHGHGISMEVLTRDLNLIIDDFEKEPARSKTIRLYSALLVDYMAKQNQAGAIHTDGRYMPFMFGDDGEE